MIIGLGNPGRRYTNTRHNVGFMVVDQLCNEWRTSKRFNAQVSTTTDRLYVKPQTMMNNSGQTVAALVRFYTLLPSDCLVVYDDKDLPFGTIRFRAAGSSAGHRGMESIIQALGTQQIPRLRIGIALTDAPIVDTIDFVLQKFTATERKQLPDILQRAVLELQKIPNHPNV